MEIILYQAESLSAGRRTASWAGLLSSFSHLSRVLGNFLIIISVLGLLFTFGPVASSEIKYRFQRQTKLTSLPVIGFSNLLALDYETILSEPVPDPEFSLVIPKIGAKAKVTANVDAANPKEYNQALKEGVAHAAGTVFPGMPGTIFLFAHSTDAPWNIRRYNAVFYLLRELEPKDEIIVFFEGKKFHYEVFEKKVTDPRQTDFFKERKEEVLVLQTCYPPGSTQKALLIFARRPSAS